MKNYFVILYIIISISVSLPFSYKNQVDEDIKKDTAVIYALSDNNYKQQNVTISYPSLGGMQNIQIKENINEQLKSEASRELQDVQSSGIDIDKLYLSVNYKVLYQSSNCLSVIYEGDVYLKDAPYPRSTFTTINIDLVNGERLVLSDIIVIDPEFIKLVKNTLITYMDKYKDSQIVYDEKLKYSDDDFTRLFMSADTAIGSDCYSYIDNEYLGLVFATSHNTGDYFIITINLDSIEKNLTPKGKELLSFNR